MKGPAVEKQLETVLIRNTNIWTYINVIRTLINKTVCSCNVVYSLLCEVCICVPLHICLLFLFQTIETYRMVDLPCSSVPSTPSSITVTISVVTARLCLCLCGRHTLSADRYASTRAGAHSDCLLCVSHCEANNVVISQAGIPAGNTVNVRNNRWCVSSFRQKCLLCRNRSPTACDPTPESHQPSVSRVPATEQINRSHIPSSILHVS